MQQSVLTTSNLLFRVCAPFITNIFIIHMHVPQQITVCAPWGTYIQSGAHTELILLKNNKRGAHTS